MILALFGDIHSNIEALDACLAHARTQGAARHIFLGDFVGYGGDPGAVVDVIASEVIAGAIAIKGNHDAAIDGAAGYMNEIAQAAIEHGRKVLSSSQKRFIAGLPMVVREGPLCFVHASAVKPEKWEYVDSPSAAQRSSAAAETTYTFSGHVHDQRLYFESAPQRMTLFRPTPGIRIPIHHHRRWLAIVGSTGQPRDRNPAAAYALFDTEKEAITFFRVPYDHHAAAKKIRAAGLPEALAYRIEHGV